eukprot:TRINITY_DN1350_c0_g2_i1.p1 TRINITY_DN1350_c0_g2~~TRINITY_DN1350_c0_g2_i1.p1  ORF type:complete len:1508 (-),score=393.15 TRINITY_DN1350_c0_g2_i1:16-4539(-)
MSLSAVSLSNYERYLKYRRPDNFKYQQDYTKMVWANTGQDLYVFGQVQRESGDELTVLIQATGEQKNFKKAKCFYMNPPKFDGVEDCSQLTQLHEPAVLYNIRVRYEVDLIHTYSGLFLVILNPYKWIPIYSSEMIDFYVGKRREDVAPHVFAMADTAYRTMLETRKNQSMLITGESGAGKTENTKKVIQYLAQIAGRGGTEGKLEKKLLQANPLLEALGNAKTLKNNNSSRFGKFIKITFDKSGFISGASIVSYLLEKSRVVHQGKGERCFHIFYQIMTMSPEDKAKYFLTSANDFGFLNQSGCTEVKGMDDKKEFEYTRQALNTLNFSEEEQHVLFSIVAAISHLGNLPFDKESKGSDNAVLKDKVALGNAAALLQIDPNKLETSIIKPKIKVGGGKEVVQKHLDVIKAASSRDALVKALYGRMFLWVVEKINKTLTIEPRDTFIGILDIAGFEIFQTNSFEQLCINFTNEKLQQFFNHHMFTLEQEEYQREKIEWTWLDFGLDSQATIDLLEKKPNGIFPLLDEESVFPNATDQTFVNKVDKAHKGRHPRYYKDNLAKAQNFTIRHYAGEVEYDTTNWLEKNRDPLETDLELTIKGSASKIISFFFEEYALNKSATELASNVGSSHRARTASASKKGAAFLTVGGAYKDQLHELMGTLEATYPHFIRCILPNRKQVQAKLEDEIVLMQLRCNGVLEGIRIQRQGFPNRMVYINFLKRYYIIAPNVPRRAADTKAASKAIVDYLVAQNVVDPKMVQYGITKIFFRVGELAKIEEAREKKIASMLSAIQDASRGFVCRKLYKKTRERAIAARVIQRNVRGWREFKNWPWFLLYQKARQIAKTRNVEKEIEERDAKIKELTVAIEVAVKEKEALTLEYGQLKSKLDYSEQLLRDEKAKANDLEATNDSLFADSQKLKNSINDLENEIAEIEARLNSAKDKGSKLDSDLKDMEDQYEEVLRNKNQLQSIKLKQEEEIKELNSQLVGEKDNVADLKRVKTKLEEQIEELSLKLDSEKSAKDQLLKTKKQLEIDLDALNDKLEDLKDKNDKQTRDVKQLQDDYKELQKEMTDTNSDLARAGDSNKQLSIEVAEFKDLLEKETKNRQGVEKAKKRLEEELASLNEALKGSERKYADINKKLKKAEDELDETKFQLDDAKSRIDQLQGRSALSGEEVKNLQDELEITRQNLKKLEAAKQSVESDLADIKDRLEAELQKGQSLDREKRAIEEELGQLHDEFDEEKRKNANLGRASAKLESRVGDLQIKLDDASTSRRDLEGKSRKLDSLIHDLELEMEGEKKIREHMDQARSEIDDKIATLEDQVKGAEEIKAELEKSRRELQNKYDDLLDKLDDTKQERADAEAQKKKLLSRVAELQAKVDAFDQERESLRQEKVNLSNHIESLKADLAQAESKSAAYSQSNNKLLSEIDHLKGEIESATRDVLKAEKLKRDAEKDLDEVRRSLDNTGDLLLKTADSIRISSKEIQKVKETNDDLSDKLISMAKRMMKSNNA